MRYLTFVSCGRQKCDHPAAAQDLYTSPLFRASAEVASVLPGEWGILSALHGFLSPGDVITPYDFSLKSMSASERSQWGEKTFRQIMKRFHPGPFDTVVILAGREYAKEIAVRFKAHGVLCVEPLDGLSLGYRLAVLKAIRKRPEEWVGVESVYALLRRLGSGFRLSDLPAVANDLPQRGVYFFFEPTEPRRGRSESRLVRVGTHGVSAGSKATLSQRLRTHYGVNGGGGAHRSSIFRQHAGRALILRDGLNVASWGKAGVPADVKAEDDLEHQVSLYLRSLLVKVLPVLDEPSANSDRAFVERNVIAAFSTVGTRVDPPSVEWLGCKSDKESIRASGLWNVDHVGRRYDPRVIGVLSRLIDTDQQFAGECHSQDSIAPRGWRDYDRFGPPMF